MKNKALRIGIIGSGSSSQKLTRLLAEQGISILFAIEPEQIADEHIHARQLDVWLLDLDDSDWNDALDHLMDKSSVPIFFNEHGAVDRQAHLDYWCRNLITRMQEIALDSDLEPDRLKAESVRQNAVHIDFPDSGLSVAPATPPAPMLNRASIISDEIPPVSEALLEEIEELESLLQQSSQSLPDGELENLVAELKPSVLSSTEESAAKAAAIDQQKQSAAQAIAAQSVIQTQREQAARERAAHIQRVQQAHKEQQAEKEQKEQALREALHQRLKDEQKKLEALKLEQLRLEAEKAQREQIEIEAQRKRQQEEQLRLEKERLEREQREQDRLQQERVERERLEQQRVEQARIETEKRVQEQRDYEQHMADLRAQQEAAERARNQALAEQREKDRLAEQAQQNHKPAGTGKAQDALAKLAALKAQREQNRQSLHNVQLLRSAEEASLHLSQQQQQIEAQAAGLREQTASAQSTIDDDLHLPLLESVADDGDYEAVPVPQLKCELWILGASLGGPAALKRFFAALVEPMPVCFLIAQHIDAHFVPVLGKILEQSNSFYQVQVLNRPGLIEPGLSMLAPIESRLRFLEAGQIVHSGHQWTPPYSPCINDVLLDAAKAYAGQVHTIIFSGMGEDGVQGAEHISAKGGQVWVQESASCASSIMPEAIVRSGVSQYQGTPELLADRLMARFRQNAVTQSRA